MPKKPAPRAAGPAPPAPRAARPAPSAPPAAPVEDSADTAAPRAGGAFPIAGQSSREQLQSLNEELTTSSDELESSNQELTTLNEEMADRNAELNRLNSDLVNLETSAQLVIVLLARNLTIRRFSAQAQKQFNLLASDVGRPIGHIHHGLELPDLEAMINEVIDTARAEERELRGRDCRWFSLRVRPYLTLDNKVDGAVLVLLDIDAIKRSEQVVVESEARYHALFEATSVGVSETDCATGRLLRVNERFARMTGYSAAELAGTTLLELVHPDDQAKRRAADAMLLRGETDSYEIEQRLVGKDGSHVWVHVTVNLVRDAARRPLRSVALTLDITERRRAQEVQAHLAAIVASSDDAIISKDLNGVITSWNKAAQHLFGYSASEAVGQPVTLLIPADQADEEPAILARIRRGETIDHYQTVRRRKDGSLFDVALTVSPIRDAAGQVIGAAKIARDITDRKRAEDVLRETEERFRSLFESAPMAIFVCDRNGVIQHYNSRAVELWGREPARGVEKHCGSTRLWMPDGALLPHDQSPIMEVLRTGVPAHNVEVFIERPTGSRLPVLVNFAALKNAQGEVTGAITSFVDITERQQADEHLRQSEQQLRFVMDSAPQKIFTARPDGQVDYFNPPWMEFTGLSFEQIRDWGWTQFIHPDDVDDNVRVWQHAIDTGEPFQFEHRFRRADGEYRWHLSRAQAMRGDDGEIMMWVGSNTDIHEQLQARQQLRQFAADLSEADRRKDEFLAMLAHELRNPLAPIRNAVEILRRAVAAEPSPAARAATPNDAPRRHDPGADGAVHSAVQVMDRQVGQMVRLVDDLLDVSRISRGKIELRRTTVELSALMQQVEEGARPISDSLDHRLTVTLPSEPVLLDADPTRLAQIIGNLIHNACKFTDRGGRIDVTVEVGDEAAAQTGARRRQLVVHVRDNGIGIGADELERIFQMFSQVDASRARSSGGLGIGLALVKDLAELHGGTVSVHSGGSGQGSEFVVRLPIVLEAAAAAPGRLRAPAATAATTLRILVVDDNRDAAESLATLLQLGGHETRLAHDGLDAVAAAAAFSPDVILLDLGLPGIDGYEAGRRIRAEHDGRGKRPLLVALTGWGQEVYRRRSAEAGFDAHLVKPVEAEALTALLSGGPHQTKPN